MHYTQIAVGLHTHSLFLKVLVTQSSITRQPQQVLNMYVLMPCTVCYTMVTIMEIGDNKACPQLSHTGCQMWMARWARVWAKQHIEEKKFHWSMPPHTSANICFCFQCSWKKNITMVAFTLSACVPTCQSTSLPLSLHALLSQHIMISSPSPAVAWLHVT